MGLIQILPSRSADRTTFPYTFPINFTATEYVRSIPKGIVIILPTESSIPDTVIQGAFSQDFSYDFDI